MLTAVFVLGIEVWDLGMGMKYKEELGARCLDRKDFISLFRNARQKVKEEGARNY